MDEKLEQVYRELGKAYYEGGFEDPLPQLLPLFDRITRLKNESGEQEAQENICPKCGMKMDSDSVFCGNCGCRLE